MGKGGRMVGERGEEKEREEETRKIRKVELEEKQKKSKERDALIEIIYILNDKELQNKKKNTSHTRLYVSSFYHSNVK